MKVQPGRTSKGERHLSSELYVIYEDKRHRCLNKSHVANKSKTVNLESHDPNLNTTRSIQGQPQVRWRHSPKGFSEVCVTVRVELSSVAADLQQKVLTY